MPETDALALFGTDGIRGRAGQYPLDHETVTRLGIALAHQLRSSSSRPGTVILGGDTRSSTAEICTALASGLADQGMEIRYAGVIPTPGIAALVGARSAAAGVAVSASHNPATDNGIKLFNEDGFKWRTGAERELEDRLRGISAREVARIKQVRLDPEPGLLEDYATHLLAPYAGTAPLAGLSISLDCANGAAAALAPRLFSALGARAEVLSAAPDGGNINLDCGSTHPQALCRSTAVAGDGGGLGFAFDGDADRAVASDEMGRLQDGDALLYLWAMVLKRQHRLEPSAVVATTMSNIGLERALGRKGIRLVRCAVGDREVVATLLAEGLKLGGEQSGHLVNLDLATTGDGLQTALAIATIVAGAGQPLSQLLKDFRRYPQVLLNIPVQSQPDLESHPVIGPAAVKTRALLGQDGRLLLRYSGTEPLARVMIEGREQAEIEALAASLAELISETLDQPRRS